MKSSSKENMTKEVIALKVNQWLKEWEKVTWEEKANRRKPESHFYIFSLPASQLKALCGIYRRTTAEGKKRSLDLGIQRRHDQERSDEIHDYVTYGFPWSNLNKSKRESGEYDDLRKPGWLPTAIVINILSSEDKRNNVKVDQKDLIEIKELNGSESSVRICLPDNFSGSKWKPKQTPPIEIIDGQHRLWAFENDPKLEDFEIPVVAYYGLDISWQAYLFWTINIKPKRINASLAFDLYPLLRTEDWLDKAEGHFIYRETRSQELTENIWSYPDSAWYQWINMLGESGKPLMVSQAAWIRSLMATYVKSWEAARISVGGLFGAKLGSNEMVLPVTSHLMETG